MRKYSEKKILADKTGGGYIFDMFYNELSKIKRRPIDMVEQDKVLTALGFDLEDLQDNPALMAGLEMATNFINDDIYEDNRPQPVDYYHFTGKNGKAIKGFTLKWFVTKLINENLTDLKFKIDFQNAVTNYILCDFGTMNREADQDNEKALKDPANAVIIGRYHTCHGDIYIKTTGAGHTEISFTHEVIEECAKRLSGNETINNSKRAGNYSVYIHVSPNGKIYVGMTESLETRFGFNGSHYRQPEFENDIKKYGWNNIDHGTIATGLTKEEAERVEHEAIILLRSQENGYNRNDGGSGNGRKAVKCLNDGKTYFSQAEAGKAYGISTVSVSNACKGRTACGLQFELLER